MMDGPLLERIQELFHATLERTPAERAAFLEEACGDDHELRSSVERYLQADSGAFDLLDGPVRLSDSTPRAGPSVDLTGKTVGHYRVDRVLGEGGMATVYLAEDLKHHREVALKVLKPELAAAVGADRFLSEIRNTANLQHPHILPLFDSGEAEGTLFYVMPRVDGETLKRRIARDGALPISAAVRILREMADGLAHAHEHGLIHRDIKPANILLSGRHALVADFGVAKAVIASDDTADRTAAGMVIGTVGYMAPEQAGGDEDLSPAVDVYAAGVVAYEMLTGVMPYQGSSVRGILSRQLSTDPRPVGELRDDVPAALAAVVMGCLARDPAERWRDGAALAAALQAAESVPGHPTSDRPAAAENPPAARRPWLKVGVPAALLVAAVAWWATSDGGAPPSAGDALGGAPAVGGTNPIVAVAVFENQTGDASLDALGLMLSDEITDRLLRTGRVRVVSSEAMRRLSARAPGTVSGDAPGVAASLSRETGAALVVTGSYFLAFDSLRIRTQLVDGTTLEVLTSPAPTATLRDDPWTGISAATGMAVTAVAQRFNVRLGDLVDVLSVPRSFAAYEQYSAGMDAFLDTDYATALRHFERAVEADSTYADARLYLAVTLRNLGDLATSEQHLLRVEERLDELSPVSRAFADLHRAWFDGDREGAYLATRRGTELAVSGNWAYQLGSEAIRVNRPQEAYDVLTSLDPESPDLAGWSPYWSRLSAATHMLGRYDEEVAQLERAVALYPEREIFHRDLMRARIAAGDADAVADTLPAMLDRWRSRLMVSRTVSELNAHGRPDLADRVLRQALAWLEARPPEERATGEHRLFRAYVLYRLGRWAEARPILEDLRTEYPGNLVALSLYAWVVTSQGDPDEIRAVDQALADFDRPYLTGSNTLWRACIAGIQGDAKRAAELLQQAYREGSPWGVGLHAWEELDPVRDDPVFQEAVRPKG